MQKPLQTGKHQLTITLKNGITKQAAKTNFTKLKQHALNLIKVTLTLDTQREQHYSKEPIQNLPNNKSVKYK
jgi:hypothetical protein